MQFNIQILSWILSLSTVINIALAVYLWGKRNVLIARYLFYLELALSIWTFAAIFEVVTQTVRLKLFWTQVSFIGMAGVPVLYFLFAMAYGQRFNYLNKKFITLIFIFPLITLIAVSTNQYHYLYYTRIAVDPLSRLATYYHGSWYYIFTIYAYGLVILGLGTFTLSLLQHKSLFKPQIVLLLIGAVIPFLGDALYIFGWTPVQGLELTPVLFTFSGLLIIWGIFKFNLLNLIPIARHRLIESMPNGVMVADKHHYIVDINPEMEKILNLPAGKILGRSLTSVMEDFGELSDYLLSDRPHPREIMLTRNGKIYYYYVEITPLTNVKNEIQGKLALLTDITDRKFLSSKLKNTENLYQSITETALLGIITIDTNSIIISANRTAGDIFGYTPSELVGQPITILMGGQIKTKYENAFEKYITEGRSDFGWRTIEVTGIHKNGKQIFLELSYNSFFMSGEHFLTGILNDITLKKDIERKTHELNELNKSIISTSPLGILTIAKNGQVTSANPAFLKMVGSPGLEQTMKFNIDMKSIHNVGLFRVLSEALKSREPFYIKNINYTSYWGKELTLNVRGVPLKKDISVKTGMVVIVEDVTKSMRLQDDYNMLAEVVTNSPIRIAITDNNGVIEYVNPAFESITGYAKDEVIGKSFNILKSGEHDDEYYKEMWDTILSGKTWSSRVFNKKKNGELFWEETTISSIKDNRGEILHFVQVAKDITEQKQMEDELTASRDMLRALSDATFESIFISEKGRCIGQNKTAERMFGYTSNEAYGRMGTEWIVEEDREKVMKHMMTGYEEPYEVTALRKDGSTFPCEIQGRMIDFHGRKVRVTALRDITRRKTAFAKITEQTENIRRLSNEMVHAHETERKTLARELHDEFGQSLTAIALYLDEIKDSVSKNKDLKIINRLSDTINMVKHMDTQIHELSLNLHPMMLDELGLAVTVNWFINRFSNRTNITVNLTFPKTEKHLSPMIEHALFRIIQESTNNISKHASATEVNIELIYLDSSVRLNISDNGVGFDPDTVYKQAQPDQKMGLLGMKERIHFLGGTFKLASKPEAGTKIEIQIPYKGEK